MARVKWSVRETIEFVEPFVHHTREFDGSLSPVVMSFYRYTYRVEVRLGRPVTESGITSFHAPRIRWIGNGPIKISSDLVMKTPEVKFTNIVA